MACETWLSRRVTLRGSEGPPIRRATEEWVGARRARDPALHGSWLPIRAIYGPWRFGCNRCGLSRLPRPRDEAHGACAAELNERDASRLAQKKKGCDQTTVASLRLLLLV